MAKSPATDSRLDCGSAQAIDAVSFLSVSLLLSFFVLTGHDDSAGTFFPGYRWGNRKLYRL